MKRNIIFNRLGLLPVICLVSVCTVTSFLVVSCDNKQDYNAYDRHGKKLNLNVETIYINGHRYISNGTVYDGYRHEAACFIHDLDSINRLSQVSIDTALNVGKTSAKPIPMFSKLKGKYSTELKQSNSK